MKALNLCGYLLSEDHERKASKQLDEANAVPAIVRLLDSPNENLRIEALYVFEMLSKFSDPLYFRDVCSRFQGLQRVSRILMDCVKEIKEKQIIFRQELKG